jgi:hypothetical protein
MFRIPPAQNRGWIVCFEFYQATWGLDRIEFASQIPAEYSEENLWPLFSPFGTHSNCGTYPASQECGSCVLQEILALCLSEDPTQFMVRADTG